MAEISSGGAPPGRTPENPSKRGRSRVLIVDDDRAIRDLLTFAFRSFCDVESAQDGSEALARLGRTPPIDLVLCDVMMPQLGGFDFLKRVQLIPDVRHTPVVFLSARGAPGDIIAAIQLGARQYITKPFKVDEVVRKVQKILRG